MTENNKMPSLFVVHIAAIGLTILLVSFLVSYNMEQIKEYEYLRQEINCKLQEISEQNKDPIDPVYFTHIVNNIVGDCVQELMKEVQAIHNDGPPRYICTDENSCETLCTECKPNICKRICAQLKPCVKVKAIQNLRDTHINYADAHLGARIVAVSGKPFDSNGGFISSIWGYTYGNNPPDKLLCSDMEPGCCFAFKDKASVTISLAKPICVEAIEIEHIQRCVSPTKNTASAPKDFVVYGIASKFRNEICLGHFVYNNCEPSQMFSISDQQVYDLIKFDFLSNHGHLDFTCVYKVGVYGNEIG